MRFLPVLSVALLASLPLAAGASPLTRTNITRVQASHTKAGALANEAVARSVALREDPRVAGLSFGAARTHDLRGGQRIIKLPQLHGGLPVIGRGTVVSFSRAGAPTLVTSTVERDLPSSLSPGITKATAITTAERLMRLRSTPSRAALVVWPTPDAAVLAWAVYAPSAGLPSAPVVIIDAQSGEPVASYNAIHDLNQASVFPSNPTKSPDRIDVTLPVGPGQATLENDLVYSQNCIDKKSLKAIDQGGFSFNVHVCDLVQTATPDANGDYAIDPGTDTDPEDAFSEVSMFYHVNRAYDYFRGFEPTFRVVPGALNTVSNLRMPDGYQSQDLTKMANPDLPLVPFQNAFFAPADPLFGGLFGIADAAIWFGQGPKRDYSYDGDVIYHEFTHAVVAATLDLIGRPHLDKYGTSYSPGSMNEGLADYFAAAISGDPDIGEYASQDISNGADAIRTLDNEDSCPGAIGGEVHQDSTLFSGGLWATHMALTPAQQLAYDEAIFVAMQSASSGDLGYEDLVDLIALSIEGEASLGQTVADALRAEFTARGVLPQCQRVIEYAGAPVSGPEALYGMWVSPGTLTAGSQVKGYAPGVIQIHLKLAEGSEKVALTADTYQDHGGFGGGGTPFAPKVLVSFNGTPVQFRYRPFASDDTVLFDASASNNKMSATMDVPAGATDAYVMVVNAGQSDGYYSNVALDVTGTFVPPTSGAGGSGGGSTGEGGSGGVGGGDIIKDDPASGLQLEADGGCAVARDDASGRGYALFAVAAIALESLRRRRRSR